MNLLLLAAALSADQTPPERNVTSPLVEAERAIAAGRYDQARIMIGNAMKAGEAGERVDRLLARLAFESGNCQAALPRYEALYAANADEALLAGRAGICAARAGDWKGAATYLDRATALPGATWRAWNARAVVADYHADYETADAAYARAAELAPTRAEIVNNRGWSLLLRGQWSEALAHFEQATALDPKSKRIANNLEIAKAALSEELPQRRADESDRDWAARLNDAGVIAKIRGENKKAVAAFAQAIEARSHWFERAANNLALTESGR